MSEPTQTHAPSALRDAIDDARDLASIFSRTLYYLFKGKREKGDIAKQMFAVGNQSLGFMCVTMGFLGAIICFQTGLQSSKLVPDMSMLGATYMKLLVRDLAASVGALPLATRVGAGIAAEIGSMVVTEQVDALRMSAADPVDYLVLPRFVACVVMGTVVLTVAGFVAIISGMLVAESVFDVRYGTFLNFSIISGNDLILGVFKSLVYGAAIAIISAQRGLRAFGGSEGVGTATTQAVVGSCFAIILLNLVISTIGHFVLPS